MTNIYILTKRIYANILSRRDRQLLELKRYGGMHRKRKIASNNSAIRCHRCGENIAIGARVLSKKTCSSRGSYKNKCYHYACARSVNLI